VNFVNQTVISYRCDYQCQIFINLNNIASWSNYSYFSIFWKIYIKL